MRNLLFAVFLLVVGASLATPAKAECYSWQEVQVVPYFICGYYAGMYQCWQDSECVNPDGTVSQDATDYWLALAQDYADENGGSPYDIDEVDLYQYWVNQGCANGQYSRDGAGCGPGQ
jgi:hypothetical protein